MTRISEAELILPALYLLMQSESMTTTQLIQALMELLKPSGEDMEILASRNDTKFSQKVRNLKSHRALSSRGLATETRTGFAITDRGRQLVEQNQAELEVLFDFQFDDAAGELSQLADGNPVVVLDERIVTEGELRLRTSEYRTRSRELRNAALETYTIQGHILCAACDFEYAAAYPRLGVGYIQIHHLKPVSFMQGEQMSMAEALANVRPLCANCHQMVHQERPPLRIHDLQLILRVTYNYGR